MLLLFWTASQAKAQILPKENSILNYRLIGFSFPAMPQTGEYKIEIATGHYNTEDSFKENIILSSEIKTNKQIEEVPSFDIAYTWRVVYKNAQSTIKSELHHFSTAIIPEVDTNKFRFRIINKAKKYKDAYVFLDGSKALYDMKGFPVWYLPGIKSGTSPYLFDLKLSPQGTITFINNSEAFEVNYNGDVLWKAPDNGVVSGDSTEHYNHDFTRLDNGHYMVLGTESKLWHPELPSSKNNSSLPEADKQTGSDTTNTSQKTAFGTIIEYDQNGNIVWSWKSSSYFTGADLEYYRKIVNLGKMGNVKGNNNPGDFHENAFYFDEKEQAIYISFKAINRVVKIKYPDGYVMNSYGNVNKQAIPVSVNNFFCGQHSCRSSEKGYLYLFDNNTCNPGTPPEIVMMQQPVSDNESLKTIWEYKCTIEQFPDNVPANYKFPTGGNVLELPDQSMFACMSGFYTKVFIVSLDKEVLWAALPEKWNPENNKWESFSQYRASIITSRQQLEQLIWNAEEKK